MVNNGGAWLCPFCKGEEEPLLHSLFWCSHALEVWQLCYKWCGVQGVFPGSIREHFLQHVLINERKKASERWIYVWIGVVWSLWKARSNIILRGSNFDKQKLIQEAQFHIWTWLKSLVTGFHYSCDQWFVCPGYYIRN